MDGCISIKHGFSDDIFAALAVCARTDAARSFFPPRSARQGITMAQPGHETRMPHGRVGRATPQSRMGPWHPPPSTPTKAPTSPRRRRQPSQACESGVGSCCPPSSATARNSSTTKHSAAPTTNDHTSNTPAPTQETKPRQNCRFLQKGNLLDTNILVTSSRHFRLPSIFFMRK